MAARACPDGGGTPVQTGFNRSCPYFSRPDGNLGNPAQVGVKGNCDGNIEAYRSGTAADEIEDLGESDESLAEPENGNVLDSSRKARNQSGVAVLHGC